MFNFEKAITKCMTEYNLTREDATRIIKTPNSDLTVNDLRYKYGNMQLGISFPNWITPENLMNMCYSVVKSHNYKGYYWYYSADELAKDLFIWASIRLNKWDNFSLLKKSISDQCKTIMRDLIRQQNLNINSISIYTHVNNEADIAYKKRFNDSKIGNGGIILEAENLQSSDEMQIVDLVESINTIQDKSIRGILILGGYFIAGIEELFDLVVKLYKEGTEVQKVKLYEMCKDDKKLCNVLKLQYEEQANCKIAIGKIMKLFGKRNKSYIQSNILPYLKKIGFIGV